MVRCQNLTWREVFLTTYRPSKLNRCGKPCAEPLFSPLSYQDLDDDDGERAVLLADFEFHLSYLGGGITVTVPKNFVIDWASVPWYLRWLLPREKFKQHGPLIRDFLYRLDGFPHFLADALFRTVMAYDRIPLHRRVLAFYAVRAFGWIPRRRSKR